MWERRQLQALVWVRVRVQVRVRLWLWLWELVQLLQVRVHMWA